MDKGFQAVDGKIKVNAAAKNLQRNGVNKGSGFVLRQNRAHVL
jgi:hypothetical protein